MASATPTPDESHEKARATAAAFTKRAADTQAQIAQAEERRIAALGDGPGIGPWPTGLTVSEGETWMTSPVSSFRRIGWIDQRGRVWADIPPSAGFDGGSLSPLIIDSQDG